MSLKTETLATNMCNVSKQKGLHEIFFSMAEKIPEHIAVIWYENTRKEISYQDLADCVLKMAQMLKVNGIRENEYIAVSMPKGIWQIISTLAILSVGCTYIPIDIDWPLERKKKICKKVNARILVELSSMHSTEIEEVKNIYADEALTLNKIDKIVQGNIKSSAYVIFTSGTTGEPKGVEITHESAVNTINDINQRFYIGKKDVCFAISELSFDLSVYDIFGMLAAGGTIVIPKQKDRKAADRWLEYIKREKVTVWNSVPAIYEMLLTVAEAESEELPLEKILLSGDWIHKELFGRTKNITKKCLFISLGGATEAAIWSVYYNVEEIKDEWNSIPYGYALSNQKVVVMDRENKECPPGIPGELWIGGVGVAKGYVNEERMTKEKFVFYENDRWYRTGDLVKKDNIGCLEFLGRIDYQIKLNGYRIELEEIENNIAKCDSVERAIVLVTKKNGRKHLAAAIKPFIPETVATVLGTLFIGGVYVPVDINSPQKRAESIISQCNSKIVLKTTDVKVQGNEKCLNIDVDQLTNEDKIDFECTTVQTKEPAYVIFTSGTTGTPKGVVVSHRAAWNTICDINETYHVNQEDRIFAISKLNFDLSVYDLFGMLSVGAAIVYVDDSNYMNPQEWHDKIVQHNVTIWNSVPALRNLYLTYLKENGKVYKESIRLSLLSGDWIPKEMPEDILNYNKNEQIICLGGATEAAIWSIAHEYKGLEKWWNSIPYGIPLRNQKFFVVDENGEDCPDWCVGELWIAGEGLADKYLGEAELSNKKFFYSHVHNCRMYRTGDMGRYIPTGEIEFLGRADNQVKIRGYRIELGEIENALEMQEEIKRAIVRIDNDKKDLPIEAVVEIAPTDQKERQGVIAQKNDILKNIEAVNIEFEEKLNKTNYVSDFAQRDKFAFVSILRGLEKVGCFEKYRTYKEMIEKSQIAKKYQWLLSRWLIALEENGYIKKYNDEYFITYRYSEEEHDIMAKNIFENWVEEYGDINLMNYIQENGKQISEILKEKVDPVGILYPEGSNKYTKALYVTMNIY